jgi:hypothetical protein
LFDNLSLLHRLSNYIKTSPRN